MDERWTQADEDKARKVEFDAIDAPSHSQVPRAEFVAPSHYYEDDEDEPAPAPQSTYVLRCPDCGRDNRECAGADGGCCEAGMIAQSKDENMAERSWKVWNMTGPSSVQWCELENHERARWTAALAEARRGMYGKDEIEKAMRDTPELGNPARNYKDVDRLIKRVLARLSAREQPSKEQPVI